MMINSTINYAKIGRRIKNKRMELKITQEQMASDLNLSTYYISKIENGKATATLDTLAYISQYLKLDLSYVISGTSTIEDTYYIDELNQICSKANKKQLSLIIRLAKAVLDE